MSATAAGAGAGSASEDEDVDTGLLSEEYRIWRQNAPYMYDVVVTHALEWPSLTVQWLPDYTRSADGKFAEQKLILGTHTSDGEQNLLMLAKVRLAVDSVAATEPGKAGPPPDFGSSVGKIEIIATVNHEDEVNRARYQPQNPNIVASKTPKGEVHVFDFSKPLTGPILRLTGHTDEGYGLAWSALDPGKLLSGSYDQRVCLWDVNATPSGKGNTLAPVRTCSAHTAVVEDVAWHGSQKDVFASVGDDRRLLLWDQRDSSDKPRGDYLAHEGEVNCVSFNPSQEFLLVTGSSDKTIALWDTRNMSAKVHTFVSHTEEVFQAQWAPFNDSILASSAADRRVNVWDLTRIGQEQSAEDAEDGPPELLFVHGGHTSRISDFSWSTNEDWMITSVAEDNILQIWQLAECIYDDDDDEEDDVSDRDLE